MQRALKDACAAVAADAPAHRELVEAAAARRVWWLDRWPDGAPHLLGLLAQDVQEAVHETVDPLWPACPEPSCPQARAHPLLVEPDLGPDPFWVCSRTGLPVAAVGSLLG